MDQEDEPRRSRRNQGRSPEVPLNPDINGRARPRAEPTEPEAQIEPGTGNEGEGIEGTLPPAWSSSSSESVVTRITRRSNTSRRSAASKTSSTLRMKVELEAIEESARLEAKQLEEEFAIEQQRIAIEQQRIELEKLKLKRTNEIQQNLIQKRLEVKMAEIPEESDGSIHYVDEDAEVLSQKLSDWGGEPLTRTKLKNEAGRKVETQPPGTQSKKLEVLKNTSSNDRVKKYLDNLEMVKDVNGELPNVRQTPLDTMATALTKTLEIIQRQELLKNKADVSGTPSSIQKGQESARRTIGKDPPSFSGKPQDWPAFSHMFRECTRLCGFSNTENLLRLNKCLTGDAKEAVQGLLSASENVPTIMKTLELRFGKPAYIVEALIEKVKKHPIMKEDQFDSIVKYSTLLNNLATTAKALDCGEHVTNPSLLKELVSHLPAAWKDQWGTYILVSRTKKASIVDFSDWMNMKAEAVSNIYTPKAVAEETSESKPKKKDKDKSKKKETVLSIASDTNPAGEQKKTKVKKCYLCEKDGHALWECKVFEKKEVNEKWEFAKDKKLCFACLIFGHQTDKCKFKKKCGKNGCEQIHHPFLHFEKKSKSKEPSEVSTVETKNDTSESSDKRVMHTAGLGRVLLKVLPVILKGPTKSLKTYALLDEGSECTLIDEQVASELQLGGRKEPFTICGVKKLRNHEDESLRVSLRISSLKNKRSYEMSGVRTVKNLALPHQTVNVKDLPSWVDLTKINLENLKNAKPTILIGMDNGHLIATEKLKRGPRNSWLLGKTRLGWTMHGNALNSELKGEAGFSLCLFENQDDELHHLVKENFSTESFGVKVLQEKLRSKENERALEIMKATTRRMGDHWETGLIWKSDDLVMPESRRNAIRRLELMERKMDKSPVFAAEYMDKIETYLKNGFARYLTKEEAEVTTSRTWYLPHFGVINPNKPGRLRFVFDAAAKSKGVSLNDMLLPGPDLLTSLPGCLIKFRQKKIGFSGDVKDFFHRVKIRQQDQNSQRFLWRGMDRDREPDVLVMTVSTFGATCSPFTSQAAKNMNAEEFKDEYPEAAAAIIQRHYMDDYLDSADSVNEAIDLIKDVTEVHRRGSFHIGKFVCSSKEVLMNLPPELCNEVETLELDNDISIERILGLSWNPSEDTLGFNLKFHKIKKEILTGEKTPTKREVLQVVMSVFDPLGLIAPYTIQGRILLQDIWRSACGWDDPLSDKLDEKWKRWIKQLDSISEFRVHRCFAPEQGGDGSRQLHVFCDGSEQAFSAVAYLRTESHGVVEVSLVMAKARVSPLKVMTIPKLELQAALMASRLANFIKTELELSIDETHLWSDSKTILRWLRSDARNYKIFVGNRIGEILELTDVSEWHWIPTKLNVADDATRDTKPVDLGPTSRWVKGPDFLQLGKEEWPEQDENDLSISEELECKPHVAHIQNEPRNSPLPDPRRFSSWLKLIRSTAWILRYIYNSRKSIVVRNFTELSVDEFNIAEKLWIKYVQMSAFGKEVARLKEGIPIGKNSRLLHLSPTLDEDGIIRIDGRTKASEDLNENAKRPIILPYHSIFTELLVMEYHKRAGHHGRERVLNDLREKYWILDMRRAVKRSWANCQKCKNVRAKPVPPEMGQLPLSRLTPNVRPFTFCGVDYFGPMEVTIGRRHEKRYGVLFTCLTMRAVHLEIAASLSTDSCIMALRRMISRRGLPREMYSDNGTNFHGANNELKQALLDLDQDKIKSELSSRGIAWNFIPPGSPHMGGCWERLVRSVKIALNAVLKERSPREEVLQTVFAEAEYCVNSRPLTYASVDPDNPRPLTPNDLLIGHGTSFPPGKFTDSDFCTRKLWRYSQKLANDFWRRWIREYLPTMTRRAKWHQSAEPIKVGDVVVIVDESLERNRWPLGKIVAVYPANDGQVRVADVQTKTGIYKRPVVKLAVLDVNDGAGPEDATPGGNMSRTAQANEEI